MYIDGLSKHAQEQLELRFGIVDLNDKREFTEQVLEGQKGDHWFHQDIGIQFDMDKPKHGRLTTFKDQEIVAIVGDATGKPMIVTVIGNIVQKNEETLTTVRVSPLRNQMNTLKEENEALKLENQNMKEELDKIKVAIKTLLDLI